MLLRKLRINIQYIAVIMKVTDQQLVSNAEGIKTVRKMFLDHLEQIPDTYHPIDIQSVKEDDCFLAKFIIQRNGNINDTFASLKESLLWRKEFGVHDIKEENIPDEFFKAGAVYPYNKDREDNSIIMMQVRMHRKMPEYVNDLHRFLVFWVHKILKENNSGFITVVMDCAESGLSNLDMDLIKFLITLFKSYYPYSLAYILIYDMPWIFNAAWKIVKSWLPEEAVEKIKFVNKTTVLDYIDSSSLPLYMGGTDEYVYTFQSQKNGVTNNSEFSKTNNVKKRVHFVLDKGGLSPVNRGRGSFVTMTSKKSPDHENSDYCFLDGMLKINPAEELVFPASASPTSPSEANITLTNMAADKAIAFKVKTNNLESYRVKPPTGIIQAGNSVEISVLLAAGHHSQSTDKFLIMFMELQGEQQIPLSELNQKWKSSPREQIIEHKLQCATHSTLVEETNDVQSSLDKMNSVLTDLYSKVQNLEGLQKTSQSRQNYTICLLFFLILLFFLQIFQGNPSSIIFSTFKWRTS